MEDELLNILRQKANDREIVIDVKYKDASFVPLVKNNIAYIVSGLIFSANDEILLMQEAKQSCYGQWYLPAGRMEANETIEDAVKREVLEETGIICLPLSLSLVEVSNKWYRFSMICENAGGSLKKTADKESLQAEWFSINSIFKKEVDLRNKDILRVIDAAYKHYKNASFIQMRPINIPQKHVAMRLLIVFYDESREQYNFVVGRKPFNHLPSFEMISLYESYNKLLKNIFGQKKVDLNFKTVLTIEHNGKPRHKNDGVIVTVLTSIATNEKMKTADNHNFEWMAVENEKINDEIKKYMNGDSVLLNII